VIPDQQGITLRGGEPPIAGGSLDIALCREHIKAEEKRGTSTS
jgi:hypothetical protein